MRHRILGLWSIFAILSAVLLGRLFVLTVRPDEGHATARWQDGLRVRAAMEHLQGKVIDDSRGRILYRNGAPLSGHQRHQELHTDSGDVAYTLHTERTEDADVERQGGALIVAGKVGLPDTWPSADSVVPELGRSGLESTFNAVLRGERPGYLGVLEDVKGQTQNHIVLKTTSKSGSDIRTTLDPAWQATADRALRTAQIPRGSLTVLDVRTNQVLAMANQSPHPWDIPAVKADIPGSVMKLVTAAAALDSYRLNLDSRFICDGKSELPGVQMKCWRVHGEETLTEAIARSCDVAFALVGTKVHRYGLQTTWDRLNLSTANLQSVDGRPVLREAENGVLFRRDGDDNGLLANTAIGQEDVRITPLQAANLASTIAGGGVYRDVQLVMDAEKQGVAGRRFDGLRKNQAMSPLTAQKLTQAMIETVRDAQGTAHYLARFPVTAAVKTGTAELKDGRVNGWMVGFVPAEQPRISFSIYTGDLTEQAAHRAVRQMAEAVLESYRQFLPS